MLLDDLQRMLRERNERETIPFLAVHESNKALRAQIDLLTLKCETLERSVGSSDYALDGTAAASSSSGTATTTAAALKHETRLRDKLERLQEEFNETLKKHQTDTTQALATANALAKLKDDYATLEQKLKTQEKDMAKKDKAISHLEQQVEDQMSITRLAEQQYNGLKETIRSLQSENDVLRVENSKMINRLVTDKEKTSGEMNQLTEMIDSLKREVDMLRQLKVHDEQRKSWFGGSLSLASISGLPKKTTTAPDEKEGRKFGALGVISPSAPKHVVNHAHRDAEAMYVRYNNTAEDMVATCGSDSVVKVWDTSTGLCKATLRGTNVLTACDISGELVVGGGSDKMCRVWNLTTERMIHQLVGHGNKITCVRIFGSDRAVITGSADRSLKVWDITHRTYKQTTTLRHSSTTQAVDVATSDSFNVISGHLDGGLRCWDLRTGDRTANIEAWQNSTSGSAPVVASGITSVQFHPLNSFHVLINAKDSALTILDMRTGKPVQRFVADEFRTTYSNSTAVWSPDGIYVASMSNTTGQLFCWNATSGKLVKKLEGHHPVEAHGIAWGNGGTNGQQVASVDQRGTLILWA